MIAALLLAATLDSAQMAALQAAFPDARVVSSCSANFSGGAANEMVVEMATAKAPAERAGLVKTASGWTVHRIDAELQRDIPVSHSFPLLSARPHEGKALKCSPDFRDDADFHAAGKLLGRAPFFTPPHPRGATPAAVCYATSEQYNNWDCVAYDPRQGRFRLYYQQVFAD